MNLLAHLTLGLFLLLVCLDYHLGFPEILVSSYSGQVMGLVDRKTVKHSDQDKLKKIKELQNEIYRLEEKVRLLTEDSVRVE